MTAEEQRAVQGRISFDDHVGGEEILRLAHRRVVDVVLRFRELDDPTPTDRGVGVASDASEHRSASREEIYVLGGLTQCNSVHLGRQAVCALSLRDAGSLLRQRRRFCDTSRADEVPHASMRQLMAAALEPIGERRVSPSQQVLAEGFGERRA
jgi:hypothetical protein